MSGLLPKFTHRGGMRQLCGDGTWGWSADIIGDDIVIESAIATWFGGDNDPQDNGETASGIHTSGNPGLIGFSLPMDFGAEEPSTKGAPLPRIPWHTPITAQLGGLTLTGPLIDLGPAKSAHHQVDLTQAAFKHFAPLSQGTIKGLKITIHGGAKYARPA